MAKRPLDEVEEFVEVGDVTHTSQNAKIHGVVNSLSPMKKSRCHVNMGTPDFGDPGSPKLYRFGDPVPKST